jgi:hypothetical protein
MAAGLVGFTSKVFPPDRGRQGAFSRLNRRSRICATVIVDFGDICRAFAPRLVIGVTVIVSGGSIGIVVRAYLEYLLRIGAAKNTTARFLHVVEAIDSRYVVEWREVVTVKKRVISTQSFITELHPIARGKRCRGIIHYENQISPSAPFDVS